MLRRLLLLATALMSFSSCSTPPPPRVGVVPRDRAEDAIVVSGVAFSTGTRVVTWDEPPGYDGYAERCRFDPDRILPSRPATGCDTPARYGPRRTGHLGADLRASLAAEGPTLENLRQMVHQLVIHYDACGTSKRCFEVLQDLRGLSVHFLLDLDGTIYQTLDLAERARHAGANNDVSVGIEIANIGCYADRAKLREWYGRDSEGRLRVTLPDAWGDGGLRIPGFVPRPRREDLLEGEMHGRRYYQYDFTEAQYAALVALVRALNRALPGIDIAAPRDASGAVSSTLLPDEQRRSFRGVLGHYHVSGAKTDPGPAFDWERVLREAEAPREQPQARRSSRRAPPCGVVPPGRWL